MDDLNMVDCASDEVTTVASPSKKLKGALVSDLGNPSSVDGSIGGGDPVKSCTSDLMESDNKDCSNSDLSLVDDDVDVDDNDDGGDDYLSDYDDYDDASYADEYALLQSQFDNVDLPPGVEVSLNLLNGPSPSESTQETKTVSDQPETERKEGATSCLTVDAASSSSSNAEGNSADSTVEENQFSNFDVVNDISDHHYANLGFVDVQPPKNWAKRIQEEWKSLKTDLPETIYVRVSEARMELLRAVIVGPSGTPYHDGLFTFDCLFPTNYPSSPPLVYYYASGLRLNPNLYDCGKVCLSLLGTWSGKSNENWVPGKSTMLQVLVSIQALILNAKPYFNEPGYESRSGTAAGERESEKYNEDAFILSLKTMHYTIRGPPKHFEDLVVHHFRQRAHDILVACKAYLEGALVGSEIDKDGGAQNQAKNSSSSKFKSDVAGMMKLLIARFVQNGSPETELESFRIAAQNYKMSKNLS